MQKKNKSKGVTIEDANLELHSFHYDNLPKAGRGRARQIPAQHEMTVNL